ncbi:MAG: hypothetical protein KDE53_27300, partial [Caldilineaceae bacterium]|nr:hypothetical protein [Caldilineaceae bacterium]
RSAGNRRHAQLRERQIDRLLSGMARRRVFHADDAEQSRYATGALMVQHLTAPYQSDPAGLIGMRRQKAAVHMHHITERERRTGVGAVDFRQEGCNISSRDAERIWGALVVAVGGADEGVRTPRRHKEQSRGLAVPATAVGPTRHAGGTIEQPPPDHQVHRR